MREFAYYCDVIWLGLAAVCSARLLQGPLRHFPLRDRVLVSFMGLCCLIKFSTLFFVVSVGRGFSSVAHEQLPHTLTHLSESGIYFCVAVFCWLWHRGIDRIQGRVAERNSK